MKTIKFTNKQQRSNLTWYAVITSAAAVLVFTGFNIGINKSFLYLIASIVSFIAIMKYAKNARFSFEEIQIYEDSYKIYFFNKMKDPQTLKKVEVVVNIEPEKVVFTEKSTGNLVGSAFKNAMEEPEKWHELIESLSITNQLMF